MATGAIATPNVTIYDHVRSKNSVADEEGVLLVLYLNNFTRVPKTKSLTIKLDGAYNQQLISLVHLENNGMHQG